MDKGLKPVPAFYCCYLLRSSVRHSSLYIGSSPHPARRLAQHNGRAKGGAVRTSRQSLQPWEMVCIVAGFPSNIAALQFEWAWHNAHLTRHIAVDDRLSLPTTRVKSNAKTGKTRKKLGRPRTSMIDKLSNLQLLLRAPYFSQWPLELRFFSQDVHKKWLSWNERASEQVRPEINILLDLPQETEHDEEPSSAQKPAKKRKIDMIGKGGVEGVDPTYARFQDVLKKTNELTEDLSTQQQCSICRKQIDCARDLFNVCLGQRCCTITHVSCLSARFLHEVAPNSVVPIRGTCPDCKSTMMWSDLMRVLSLRNRAQKEVVKLLKKRNRGAAAVAAEILEDDDNNSDDEPESDNTEVNDEDDEDDAESDLGENTSVAIADPFKHIQMPTKHSISARLQVGSIEVVIEDSEDEG